MEYNTTDINGTTYEYRSENEGKPYGQIDTPTLHDAVDYFHGDGRCAFQVSRHTAFVTEGDMIHLHTLPNRDEQCPEDSHGCLGHWNVENFGTMLDGLRILAKGVEIDGKPRQILNTMDNHMDEYRPTISGNDTNDDTNRVPRID